MADNIPDLHILLLMLDPSEGSAQLLDHVLQLVMAGLLLSIIGGSTVVLRNVSVDMMRQPYTEAVVTSSNSTSTILKVDTTLYPGPGGSSSSADSREWLRRVQSPAIAGFEAG